MCLLLFPLIMSKAVHSTKSLFPHITFGELPIFSVIMTWTVRNDITRIRSRILIEFSHYTVKYRKETCMRSNLCDFSFVGQAHHSVCSINCLQKACDCRRVFSAPPRRRRQQAPRICVLCRIWFYPLSC